MKARHVGFVVAAAIVAAGGCREKVEVTPVPPGDPTVQTNTPPSGSSSPSGDPGQSTAGSPTTPPPSPTGSSNWASITGSPTTPPPSPTGSSNWAPERPGAPALSWAPGR